MCRSWRLCRGLLLCDQVLAVVILWECWVVYIVFFALVSSLSLRLFRFVEISIFSGCSVLIFFFLILTGVELLIRLLVFLRLLLLLLLLLFCCNCSFSFLGYLCPLFWFWVGHRFWSRISGWADGHFLVAAFIVVDVAAGYCLMTFVGRFWQDDPVVCRTNRVASCPPRPP